MRLLAACLLALTCSAPSPSQPAHSSPPAYDVIIANGDVIDGTGKPRYHADVALRGDTIVKIGDLSHESAAVRIDATGRVVAPGFIDLLGNSQAAVLLDPKLEGKIRQGVTTEVTGEGHSPGPQNEPMAAEMERTKPAGWPPVTWRTLGEFMKVVEQHGSALNFAFYVGAANPREMVLGDANVDPTPDQLRQMQAIVEQSVREGAVGLASALIYPPGRFAKTAELTALAKPAGAYWTHLRSESSGIDAAIDEALQIGRDAHVPVNIFHLKIGGRENWGRMPEVVARIERARKAGQDVASCIYPYTATSTELLSLIPAQYVQGGYLQFLARLKNPATRKEIADTLRNGRLANGGASTIAVRGQQGRLDEIAKAMNTDPAEAMLRLFEQSTKSPIGIYFSLSEDDMKYALKQPWVAVCSDSGAVVPQLQSEGAHPRAYGSFARILAVYVREQKLISLEEAVRKMTSLAASRAFLRDRGALREGMKADVIVLDPARVRDLSTYDDPHHFSEGVDDVIVNGKPVLRGGKFTGVFPGRVLERAGASGGQTRSLNVSAIAGVPTSMPLYSARG